MPPEMPEDLQEACAAYERAYSDVDCVDGDGFDAAWARLQAAKALRSAVIAKYRALRELERAGA